MNVSGLLRRLALLGALLVALTACASKGLPPAQRAAVKQAEAQNSQGDGEGSAGPADSEAAKKEISAAYVVALDGPNPDVEGKLALIHKGESVRAPLITAMTANAATFAQLTARVDNIEFESKDRAKTTFTLLVGGVPTLEGFTGAVVNVGGKWLIEAQGVCDLVALADASLPCKPG